jgi:hypothetical protein
MNALAAEKILDPEVSIQSKIAAWLVNKSDTTILLFLLLYGVWVKSESMMTSIQDGYDRNAMVLEKAVDKLVVEREKDRQFFMVLLAREVTRHELEEGKAATSANQ